MADANTEVSLDDLHAAIVADVHAAFPALATVQFYREEDDRTPLRSDQLPACLLQVSEFEGDNDNDGGTEQLTVQMRFDARLVIGFKTSDAKLSIRKLAASFAAWLRKRRFVDPHNPARKLPTGAAVVIGGYPDDFSPELDQYEVWRVEWMQTVDLGSTVWTPGIAPTGVLASFAPNIGLAHVADYKPIQDVI
jgi:hypothetical protein